MRRIETLPGWEWYDVADTIEKIEERIKDEKEEKDIDNAEPYYKKWVTESEKEDAQIDEMFRALRM